MKAISKEELKELYEKDFPLWVEINLQLLKEKAYHLVDWENLLEEIEDMWRRELDVLVGYLAVILEHLYKLDNFQSLAEPKESQRWLKNIRNAREEIEILFDWYPSLKNKLPNEVDYAWEFAKIELLRWAWNNNIDLSKDDLPDVCPYTYEKAMTRDLNREMKG
mgnify:FL=1